MNESKKGATKIQAIMSGLLVAVSDITVLIATLPAYASPSVKAHHEVRPPSVNPLSSREANGGYTPLY